MRILTLLTHDVSPDAPALVRVITPNRLAARRHGVPACSLDDLARQQLDRAGLTLAAPLEAHRLLEDAASEIGAAGLANTLLSALHALFHAGSDLAALTGHGEARVRRVAALGLAYRARLRERGLVDAAEMLSEALRRGPVPQALHVVGYARLGPDQRAFLDASAGPGSRLCLPAGEAFTDSASTAAQLGARGWTIEKSDDEELAPVTTAHAFATRAEELRHVLARVKVQLDAGTPPADIALVVRDDADFGPLALDLAWVCGVPLRALYAVPVAETRLGGFLLHLLEAADHGLPYEATYRTLDHVLAPRLTADVRAACRKTRPVGAAAWQALGVDVEGLCWPSEDTRANWVVRIRTIVRGARHAAFRWARERGACQVLLQGLPSLAGPETIDRATFAQALREALHVLTTPAQPGRGGVELHTPLSVHGARYAHVYVLGLAEGLSPAPVRDDVALDFFARKQIVGLEDAAAAARRERLTFHAMLRTAKTSLVLSVARADGAPSAYFQELKVAFSPAPTTPTVSLEAARQIWAGRSDDAADPRLAHIRTALAVERRREGDAPADAHDGRTGLPFPLAGWTFSATQLTAIGQCPFKWFATYALGLRLPDEADDDLTPALRGSLYHRTLELAATACLGLKDPRPPMLDALPQAFLQAETDLQLTVLPAWRERREQHLVTLNKAVRAVDFLGADARMSALEADFKGNWHGLPVKGRVDRVDVEANGATTLVDYKTGGTAPKGAQDATGKATLDLQLPLYMAVAAPAIAPGQPAGRAYYYSLSKARILKEVEGEDPHIATLMARIRERMDTGDFPVAPDVDAAACTYCDHAIVCRRGPRLARKGEAP